MFGKIDSTLLHAIIIVAVLTGLLADCSPPPTPVTQAPVPTRSGPGMSPVMPTPIMSWCNWITQMISIPEPKHVEDWHELLQQKEYNQIIQRTNPFIDIGETGSLYPEAHLYRGLAILQGKDVKAARSDLEITEKLMDRLTPVNKTPEQKLLFCGQMVVNAKLGDFDAAKRYRDQFIQIAPNQQQAIQQEFELAIQAH